MPGRFMFLSTYVTVRVPRGPKFDPMRHAQGQRLTDPTCHVLQNINVQAIKGTMFNSWLLHSGLFRLGLQGRAPGHCQLLLLL